jgi:hypothetical protein
MWLRAGFFKRCLLLALFAAVMGALLPVVEPLRQAASAQAADMVCSSVVDAWQSASNANDPVPEQGHLHNQCGHCLLQQHSPALTMGHDQLAMVPPMSDHLYQGGSGTTMVKRFGHTAHLSRAPPHMA